jgi:alkylation response protein AidB-like acyl-CoA dehydrogenase
MSTTIDASALTDVQRQVVDLARTFAAEQIAPHAAEWDRAKALPRSVLDALGGLGFLGMRAPEAYDGMGADAVTYLLALEEISAADASVAVTMAIQNAIPITMLTLHGTEGQKDRWLRPTTNASSLGSAPTPGAGVKASSACCSTSAGSRWATCKTSTCPGSSNSLAKKACTVCLSSSQK